MTTKAKLPGQVETVRNGPQQISPRQEAVALSLAGGATIDEAAKKNNTGVTTVKTWLAEHPAFRQRITEARAELGARVLGRIVSGMVVAIETLERLCVRGKTEATQLKASEALLTHGTALSEVAQLKARMDELERGNETMNLANLRGRLAKLEKAPGADKGCKINWDNLSCAIEDIQPDDSGIDWISLRDNTSRDEPCPIEARIAAILAVNHSTQENADGPSSLDRGG